SEENSPTPLTAEETETEILRKAKIKFLAEMKDDLTKFTEAKDVNSKEYKIFHNPDYQEAILEKLAEVEELLYKLETSPSSPPPLSPTFKPVESELKSPPIEPKQSSEPFTPNFAPKPETPLGK